MADELRLWKVTVTLFWNGKSGRRDCLIDIYRPLDLQFVHFHYCESLRSPKLTVSIQHCNKTYPQMHNPMLLHRICLGQSYFLRIFARFSEKIHDISSQNVDLTKILKILWNVPFLERTVKVKIEFVFYLIKISRNQNVEMWVFDILWN